MHRNRIFIGVEVRQVFEGTSNPIICPLTGHEWRDAALVYDGHRHLHRFAKKKPTASVSLHEIEFVSMAQCQQHHALFVLAADGNLCIYTLKDLTFLTKVQMALRHALEIIYVNSTRQLFVWMPSELICLSLTITTNHKTARFASSMYFNVQETARRSVRFPQHMKWISLQKQVYLVMGSLTDLTVYNCSTKRHLTELRQLTPVANQLTAATVSSKKAYLIAGYSTGSIVVYELSSQRHLINQLEGHRRRVLALYVNQQDTELISYGEDETIRIYSLHSMQTLEVFAVGRKFHRFEYLSERSFIGCEDSYTFTGEISSKLELLYEHRSELECQALGKEGRHLLALTNNTLLELEYSQEKVIKGYTPPNCKQVLQMDRNHYVKAQQYWLLTNDKEIYVYELDRDSSTPFQVTAIHQARNFISMAGNSNTFDILTLKFVRVAPLKYDAQIKGVAHQVNEQSNQEFQGVALGSSRGDILVVSSLSINHVQSRVRFHKQPIVAIEELEVSGKVLMLTLCKGKRLVVGRLTGTNEPQIVTQVDLSQQFVRMFFSEGYLVLTYLHGSFEICQFEDGEFLSMKTEQSKIQHQDLIVCARINRPTQRVVTSSLDRTVKVWSLAGSFLFEVHVGGMVEWVYLSNDRLLMLIAGGWLAYLPSSHYQQYLSHTASRKLLPSLTEKQPIKLKQNADDTMVSLPFISLPDNNEHRSNHTIPVRRRRDFSQHLLNRQHTKATFEIEITPPKRTLSPKTRQLRKIEGYESYFHLPDPQFVVKLFSHKSVRR